VAGTNPPERANAGAAQVRLPNNAPIAIISDIHGNLEALIAVLAEIDRRDIKHIVCLGDVIGYGPNPLECMDLVIERTIFSLMGNHDFAIFFEPFNFNAAAESAAYWTRMQFERDASAERRNRRWRYLGMMITRYSGERFYAYHGSPRRPINEYVFPDDAANHARMSQIFERFPKLCFVGHTHVPGVFLPTPEFLSPDDLHNVFEISAETKAMINIGSVGQPRDRNPKSSFVILYPDRVEFLRVPYDVMTTVEKIKKIGDLDNFLGARLLEGR